MSSVGKVVHVMSSIGRLIETLSKCLPNVHFIDIPTNIVNNGTVEIPTECIKQLKDAEILIVDSPIFPGSVAQSLPLLKWVQSTYAGVDGIINSLDISKPYPSCVLTRLSGKLGPPMAENIVGQILQHELKTLHLWEAQKRKEWVSFPDRRLLRDLTIGIIGMGDIGRDVAEVCKKGFGMNVWGLVRHIPKKEDQSPNVDVYKVSSDLPDLLKSCDVICSILPSTTATRDLFSGNTLEVCKSKCPLFINVGRGDVMSEESVLNALRQKWISAAVLDVFVSEPLPKDSPLWTEPNVIITPHVSGVTTDEMLVDIFVDNYQRYVDNKPLKYTLQWEHGY
ncbi:glyoxylate/hydroxypyruvate reductase B-like isoform X2 [Tubulanus polymorphus]|uniref:glyoxylate/hydroxypyruvate reductase B-like isoform X2 n=1 Tax=Tubulanus polymorphus TaxID=672921 RepID=UPI003DA677D0